MDTNLLKYKLYEKVYMDFVVNLYPVIEKIKVYDGNLTDLFVHIEYEEYYNSEPEGFLRAIRYSMIEVNQYFGTPKESFTIGLYKGLNLVAGTFIEG